MKNNLLGIHCPHNLFDSITQAVFILWFLYIWLFPYTFLSKCHMMTSITNAWFPGLQWNCTNDRICLLANLDLIRYKPIYPQTSLGLEINQFSRVTRTRLFSSNQSCNNKPIYELEQFNSFGTKLSHLKIKNSEEFEVKLIYICKAFCCGAFI